MKLGYSKARWLMYQGEPQKYGTNYVTDGVRHRLWDVEPETTDTERAAWNVPPLRNNDGRPRKQPAVIHRGR